MKHIVLITIIFFFSNPQETKASESEKRSSGGSSAQRQKRHKVEKAISYQEIESDADLEESDLEEGDTKIDLVPQEFLYIKEVDKTSGRGLFCTQDIKEGQIIAFYGGPRITEEEANANIQAKELLPETNYYIFHPHRERDTKTQTLKDCKTTVNGWSDMFNELSDDQISSHEDMALSGAGDPRFLDKTPSIASFCNHRRSINANDFKQIYLTNSKLKVLKKKLKERSYLIRSSIVEAPMIRADEESIIALDLDDVCSSVEKQNYIKAKLLMMNGLNSVFTDIKLEQPSSRSDGQQVSSSPALVAIRDIRAGEEICVEYGTDYSDKIWSLCRESKRNQIEAQIGHKTLTHSKPNLYPLTYKTKESTPGTDCFTTTFLPTEGFLILYYGLFHQEIKDNPTLTSSQHEEIFKAIKEKFFPHDFNIVDSLKFHTKSLSKEQRKTFKELFFNLSEDEDPTDKMVLFLVENFNILEPFYKDEYLFTLPEKSPASLQKTPASCHSCTLSSLLLLRCIDPSNKIKIKKYSISKKLTKSILKNIFEQRADLFIDWCSGKPIALDSLVNYDIGDIDLCQRVREELIKNKILDSDYTISHSIASREDLESFIRNTADSLTKAGVHLESEEDIKLKRVLSILLCEGFGSDPVQGDQIIGCLTSLGLLKTSNLIQDTIQKSSLEEETKQFLQKELVDFENPFTGKKPTDYAS